MRKGARSSLAWIWGGSKQIFELISIEGEKQFGLDWGGSRKIVELYRRVVIAD